MKILAGSFQCEANTFCSGRAEIEDFEVFYEEEALEKMAAVPILRAAGAQVIPLLYASALPSGMVKREAFEYYKSLFIERVKKEADADGIYLYLHGSMYVEGLGSGEEGLLKAIREVVGMEIPITAALDFHANLSDGFIRLVNGIEGFRTAPHVDQDDTEIRAAKGLLKCIQYHVTPIPEYIRIPFLGGDASVTDREPFLSVTKELERLDQEERIVSCGLFNGQPWYDAPYTGNCAVVSAIGHQAGRDALKLAECFWAGRDNLVIEHAMETEEAVETSLKNQQGVLFVTDSGDNTTAGAKGSGTLLLRKYLKRNPDGVLICGIFDRETANLLLEKEIGEKAEITLCKGRCEAQEIETKLMVQLKNKGIVYGWAGDEAGEGVLVSCKGMDILLTNARAAFTSEIHFQKMHIELAAYHVIVLKMGYLFPKLRKLSEKTIFALTPGTSTNDFGQLPYQYLHGKRYPICKDITWEDILEMKEGRREQL